MFVNFKEIFLYVLEVENKLLANIYNTYKWKLIYVIIGLHIYVIIHNNNNNNNT